MTGEYFTGLIGKWHLGGAAEFHPMRHGFDEFFGFTTKDIFVPPPWRNVTTMLRKGFPAVAKADGPARG